MKKLNIISSCTVGGLLMFMGAVALPAQAQKTITMSFEEGALKDGESLSRSAFRNRLANSVKIRYEGDEGDEPVQVQIYVTLWKAGKLIKDYLSDPYELFPGESDLPEGLVPLDDWFPGGAAASWCFCPIKRLQTLIWGPLTGENVAEEDDSDPGQTPWDRRQEAERRRIQNGMSGNLIRTSGGAGIGMAVVPVLREDEVEPFKVPVAVFPSGGS